MTTIYHPLLAPYKPTADDPFDAVKAGHLYNRAGVGGTPADVARAMQAGSAATVEMLLDFPDAPADEQSQTDLPDFSSIEGMPKSFREYRQSLMNKTEDEKKELVKQYQAANAQAIAETGAWWLRRLAYGPHPLQEKLLLFWHGHFTTSAKDERAATLLWSQHELLRSQAAGNFAQLVHQISHDPAMLDYLNNTQNHKGHPNENYARELMELFTLGIGNYTETDIKQSARAFTGWSHDGDEFVFRKGDHDTGDKTFMGRTGNFDGNDICDMILARPVCAEYIGTRLWNFFVSEDTVDPPLAQALGRVLRENDYQLRPLLRTIFNSQGFYAADNIGGQIKSPVQLVTGTIRLLNLDMPGTPAVMGSLRRMGQVPFDPPNVKGWPGGRMWVNTSTLFVRYNTGVWLAGGTPVTLPAGRLAKFFKNAGKGNGDTVAARPVKFKAQMIDGSPDAVVDAWVARLIQRPITDDKRKTLLAALNSDPSNEQNILKMIQLIVSMPDYQLC